MFLARRPSRRTIERFLEASRNLPLSYGPVGLAAREPEGYDMDDTDAIIGRGEAAFERAKAALDTWEHFALGWVELSANAGAIAPGTLAAVLIRHLGFWSLNGCRVLYMLGDRTQGESYGFAYGTLSNHAEQGEEIFEVLRRSTTDDVVYRIRAVSRPRAALARLGYPVARILQARFRRDSADAMRRAVSAGGSHQP